MSMRKWERGVAKHRMEVAGFQNINKKKYRYSKRNKTGEERTFMRSAFSLNWRDILEKGTRQFAEYRKREGRRGKYLTV